jgi:hypothetical protein
LVRVTLFKLARLAVLARLARVALLLLRTVSEAAFVWVDELAALAGASLRGVKSSCRLLSSAFIRLTASRFRLFASAVACVADMPSALNNSTVLSRTTPECPIATTGIRGAVLVKRSM